MAWWSLTLLSSTYLLLKGRCSRTGGQLLHDTLVEIAATIPGTVAATSAERWRLSVLG